MGGNLGHGRFPKEFAVREKPFNRFGFGIIRIEAQARFEFAVGREIRIISLDVQFPPCRMQIRIAERATVKALQNPPDETIDAASNTAAGMLRTKSVV